MIIKMMMRMMKRKMMKVDFADVLLSVDLYRAWTAAYNYYNVLPCVNQFEGGVQQT